MPKINAGANVTLTLTDWDSVTVATAGVAVLTVVSGLDVPAGKLAELTGSRTFGPFAPGSLRIDASVVECSYEVADGVRPVAASGGGVAAITGSYVVGQTLTATFPAGVTGTIQFTRTLTTTPFTKTAISGAVASAVNSLTYQVQQADVGYTIGVDCTTVQSGVGSTVSSGGTSAAIVQQSLKLRSNDMYSNGASGLATFFYKVELESMADAVQWVIGSGVGSGTPGEYMAQAAFTDEIRVDTATRAFVPMRGGVAYNEKSEFGWKDMTFGGATSKRIGLAPSTGNSCVTMATDVLSMPSVARADGKPGCILLVKVVQIDSAGAYTQDKSTNQAWDAARGLQPYFREFFSVKRNGVNAITTLTALPTGVAESNTGYCAIGYPIVTLADKSVPAELVMFTGDSVRAAAYSTYAFNNPNCQALLPLSTPARPISIVNLTGSGHSQIQYLQVALDALNSGLRPTVLYMPGFSQNGFNSDPQGFIDRNNAFMASVRAITGLANIKFVLDTDYWGVPSDVKVRQCINYAKSLANGSTVFCFDSELIMFDYSNPSAPVRRADFMNADGIHANQAGQDALTYGDGGKPGLQALYKTIFGIP
jgi:hypothetical protein